MFHRDCLEATAQQNQRYSFVCNFFQNHEEIYLEQSNVFCPKARPGAQFLQGTL